MQKIKFIGFSFRGNKTSALFKIITPLLLVILLFSALTPPLRAALTPARDLNGTWSNAIPEKYYDMDPGDSTAVMNDANVTYTMKITQTGSSISILLNINVLSYVTDPAYWNDYGMNGVPMVGFNQIVFSGTVSGASFSADEQYTSTGNQEHIAGTFTTDIITATLTGPYETTDVNGIIVLRSGSSATLPPFVTASPTPSPTPAPALPTSDNLGSVSLVQGSVWDPSNGQKLSIKTAMGTGAEVKTGNDGMVTFNYPDNGGAMTVGANSDAGWVYLEPQTDPITGQITYVAVPPSATGAFAFSEGIEPDEFGQAGLSLAAEVGVGLAVLAVTGAPITLGGALVVEGTLLLGSGIAYVNEQLSPQQGTYDVRPVQVPQGLVMGSGTQYVVSVNNGATTIQVIEGSVLFVDQYSNNTVTIQANQQLILPAAITTGFTTQELQAFVFASDSSSINQWWTQITPTATATPTIIVTSTTTVVTQNTALGFLFDPMIIAAVIVAIILVIAIVFVVLRSKSHSRKHKADNQYMPQPAMPQTPQAKATATETQTAPLTPIITQPKLAFCPNCGKPLSNAKGFCPFCGFDLGKFTAEK